jgi:hypothetical protein
MNLRAMVAVANRAKRVIDDRGGTERLKQDAERLRAIANGPGTPQEKAKAAGEALKAKPASDPDAPGDAPPPPAPPAA